MFSAMFIKSVYMLHCVVVKYTDFVRMVALEVPRDILPTRFLAGQQWAWLQLKIAEQVEVMAIDFFLTLRTGKMIG